MPLPKPTPNEDREKFIDRCMADDVMNKEFPDGKQRIAVCSSQYTKSLDTKSDKVSDRVEKSLKNKLKDHREKVGSDKRKQTTLRKLKIVFNRGVGAYHTNPSSVRPSVKSPEQWAQARVNSFLYALRNLRYRGGKHDTDLLPTSHPSYVKDKKKKAADSHRKYPDGEPIPSQLPDKYRKSKNTGETKGQACINCHHLEDGREDHRYYCDKFEAPVRPQYWCAAWKAEEKTNAFDTYNDYPESASNNAKRALKYKDENPDNDCGTAVGWTRANQLAKREKIGRDTIARMASFKRHQQHKDVPYGEGCGGLMWDAWGGTSGVEWAIRKLAQIDKSKKNRMNKQFAFAINNADDVKVSREDGTMLGVSLISVGPALGHELYVDKKSLDTIMDELGRTKLPAYITHRGALFEDRLTREIGIFTNFRIVDDRILGDFQAFDSFREDDTRKFNRLFELAEKMPERFGLSIVFSASSAWATDVGDVDTAEKPEDALFNFPSIRVDEVSSADFVDQPAANQKGLFDKIDTKPVYKMTKAELLELTESLEAEQKRLAEENHQLSVRVTDAEAKAEELEIQLGGHSDDEKEMDEHEDEMDEHEDEKMAELQKALDEALAEIASLKEDVEAKEKELAEKDEKMAEDEEKMKAVSDEKESASVKASELSVKVESLEKLIKGSGESFTRATDDETYSPSKESRAKIISEFAKENNISEFSATLRLGKERPELFKL